MNLTRQQRQNLATIYTKSELVAIDRGMARERLIAKTNFEPIASKMCLELWRQWDFVKDAKRGKRLADRKRISKLLDEYRALTCSD